MITTPYMVPRYRVALVRESGPAVAEPVTIRGPEGVYNLLRGYFADADREHFVVLMVDVKRRLIGLNVVSVGHLHGAPVHPREVFKAAILANAAAIIVAHNHPSGDPEPSPEDLNVTRRLKDAGKALAIELLDHIIVGDGRYVSLMERGDLS